MKKLSRMIKSKKPLVIPGVYDAIGAKIAEKVGFDAMFQTGYGTSATLFGMPDYDLLVQLKQLIMQEEYQMQFQCHLSLIQILVMVMH